MSTLYFNNKKILFPGSYARITSGKQTTPLNLSYGNILIIDNPVLGSVTENGIMGGSGIAGEHTQGINSIYSFDNLQDLQDFIGAGKWYKAAELLFNEQKNYHGASKVYVVKPSTTKPSEMIFTATGGGSNGGTFKFKTLDEGLAPNGVVEATNLVGGYAFTIETGVIDNSKFIFKIWRSTYRGAYSDDIAYNEIDKADSTPILIVSSPEFNNIQDLIDWASSDFTFASFFLLDATSAIAGTGEVDSTDAATAATYQVSTGGTETYDQIDEALTAVKELDYSFVITTHAGDASVDTNILKIQAHLSGEAKFDKMLWTFGDDNTLAASNVSAKALNDEKIALVHGAIYRQSYTLSTGRREWGAFFHSCLILGRVAGLAPQVPLTFKSIDIKGLKQIPTDRDKENALKSGVLMTIYDYTANDFVILKDVNTLQKNTQFVNLDGTSYIIQFYRIKSQLNKELIVNARLELLSDESGVNRSTLSEQDLTGWTKGYLQRKLATKNSDNLILSYKNVVTTVSGTSYLTTYEFEPNSEITQILFTGYAI